MFWKHSRKTDGCWSRAPTKYLQNKIHFLSRCPYHNKSRRQVVFLSLLKTNDYSEQHFTGEWMWTVRVHILLLKSNRSQHYSKLSPRTLACRPKMSATFSGRVVAIVRKWWNASGSWYLAPSLELCRNDHGCYSQNKDKSLRWFQDAGTYAATVSFMTLWERWLKENKITIVWNHES